MQVATGDNHHLYKWNVCTIETPQAQGAKVRASISASQYEVQQQYATTTTITSQMQVAQYHTCSNHSNLHKGYIIMFVWKMVSPYTSCIDGSRLNSVTLLYCGALPPSDQWWWLLHVADASHTYRLDHHSMLHSSRYK